MRIPNHVITSFLCKYQSQFGVSAISLDPGSSAGSPPNDCPYTARELGAFEHSGEIGEISKFRLCWRVWNAIGAEHRAWLSAFYLRTLVCSTSFGVPKKIENRGDFSLDKIELELLVQSAHRVGLVCVRASDAEAGVYAAHVVWDLEYKREKNAEQA